MFEKHDANELAVSLANIKMDTSETSSSLPQMVTFLEMFKVQKTEHLK